MMEAMLAGSMCFSSLEPEDLEEFSSEEESTINQQEENSAGNDLPSDEHVVRDKYIRPRFEQWYSQQACGNSEGRDLLLEMWNMLVISNRYVLEESSERHYHLEFFLVGMQCSYLQVSQADPSSPTWDTQAGCFEPIPNVTAQLDVDGETVIACRHFTAPISMQEKTENTCFVDEHRLTGIFGSDNILKLRGMETVLQFIGVICADADSFFYADSLPFTLSSELVKVAEVAEVITLAERKPPPDDEPSSKVKKQPVTSKPPPDVGTSKLRTTGSIGVKARSAAKTDDRGKTSSHAQRRGSSHGRR